MDQSTSPAVNDEELNMSDEEAEENAPKPNKEENTADSDADEDEEHDDIISTSKTNKDKKCVPGIVYLGHIPPRLRPKHVRNMLGIYGEIGRIFLQSEGQYKIFALSTSFTFIHLAKLHKDSWGILVLDVKL